MGAYSKDIKNVGKQTTNPIQGPPSDGFVPPAGMIRIDTSLLPAEHSSGVRSTGILRELEALCCSMREMELTIGKEKNKNIKLQQTLRDAQQRIFELTGSVENLKGEIIGQQAKEGSFAEQMRSHSQKLSTVQCELETSQRQLSDERRRHTLECESLKLLVQNEQKKFQILEKEFNASQRDAEKRMNYNSHLQQFNSSIQEKKLQSELNKQIAAGRSLEETIYQLKEEIARGKVEVQREQAKLLQTSLELRKALAQLKNGETEVGRYKIELARARDKAKVAESAVLSAKRESLAAAERETAGAIAASKASDTFSLRVGPPTLPGTPGMSEMQPLKDFISIKDKQISDINRELDKLRPGQPEKKKVDQILNLMVEQRDQLKEIVTELEDGESIPKQPK